MRLPFLAFLASLAVVACTSDPNPVGCQPGARDTCACGGGMTAVFVCPPSGVIPACPCVEDRDGAVRDAGLDAPVPADVGDDRSAPVDLGPTDTGVDARAVDALADVLGSDCTGSPRACTCPDGARGTIIGCVTEWCTCPHRDGGTDAVADTGACPSGLADCDGTSTNGCETDTRTSALHCGACGHVCPVGRACVAGSCGRDPCLAGYGDCDGVAANGCETSTRSSSAHCGSCGHACRAGQRCVASVCVTDGDAAALDAAADVPRND